MKDSIINLTEEVLRKEFKRINKKYFDNKVREVPVKLNNSGNKVAVACVRVSREGGRGYKAWRFSSPQYIAFSKKFSLNKKELELTMIHEMIHILMAQNNEADYGVGMHGESFGAHCFDIESKFGFKFSIPRN